MTGAIADLSIGMLDLHGDPSDITRLRMRGCGSQVCRFGVPSEPTKLRKKILKDR